MRKILLKIEKSARERTPMNAGNSRKGFQDSMPSIITLGRVEILLCQ